MTQNSLKHGAGAVTAVMKLVGHTLLNGLRTLDHMTVTNEGLRMELTESEKGTFFDSGSVKISGDGAELLKTFGKWKGTPTRNPTPPAATRETRRGRRLTASTG